MKNIFHCFYDRSYLRYVIQLWGDIHIYMIICAGYMVTDFHETCKFIVILSRILLTYNEVGEMCTLEILIILTYVYFSTAMQRYV